MIIVYVAKRGVIYIHTHALNSIGYVSSASSNNRNKDGASSGTGDISSTVRIHSGDCDFSVGP